MTTVAPGTVTYRHWIGMLDPVPEHTMASRLSLEDKLAAIRAIRNAAEPSGSHSTELKRYLLDRSNLVVAAAAALAGERANLELAADMEAAFDRFLVDPVKNDKLCRAKIAIVQALDKIEHLKRDIFETAARHIQLEPAWGKEDDTAAPLRGAALFALARIGGSDYHCLLVDSLTDSEKDVRIAAAQALAYVGTEAAALVLRLKARLGDADADVLSECLSGLLTIGPEANLGFVCTFLRPLDPPRCEAAALALGKTKLPGALEALKSCWQKSYEKSLRDQILLAISMMRLPAAIDFLLELVASDSESSALSAMTALKFHRYDGRLCERLAQTVKRTGSRALQFQLDRDFAASP
jgi:HEAT repeat protein